MDVFPFAGDHGLRRVELSLSYLNVSNNHDIANGSLMYAHQVITELKWTQGGDKHQVDEIRSDPWLSHMTGCHEKTGVLSFYKHLTASIEKRDSVIDGSCR